MALTAIPAEPKNKRVTTRFNKYLQIKNETDPNRKENTFAERQGDKFEGILWKQLIINATAIPLDS